MDFTWTAHHPLFRSLFPPIKQAIVHSGFTTPTPVQQATIPLFLTNKDVVVEACTGSGKTLAFLIPILQITIKRYVKAAADADGDIPRNEIAALIISPTRELAKQIFDVLTTFIHCLREYCESELQAGTFTTWNKEALQAIKSISHMLCIGGNSISQDIADFSKNGGHILIGTPGRVNDLLNARSAIFNVKELDVLVLDEADRLLDLGFELQLTSILQRLPKQRRTGLFSATMSDAINELIRAGLRNPVHVHVKVETVNQSLSITGDTSARTAVMGQQRTPASLAIQYLFCNSDEKLTQLFLCLEAHKDEKCIVYFSTCACVDYFYKVIQFASPAVGKLLHSLHGKMDPKRRQAVYAKFTESPPGSVLLCTDVAARGLDIPDIDLVIQYDPPQDPKAFAHRCGRTARSGKEGRALVFLTPQEDTYVEFLRIRKIPMAELTKFSETTQWSKEVLLDKTKAANRSDRDVYEKSLKAFVSWVRSYKEHEASYIFQFSQVDLAAVARSFGLFRLPKMPELKGLKIQFEEELMDVSEIAFKDKARERQRRQNADSAPKKIIPRKGKQLSTSWSKKKDQIENRLVRREKKVKKRLAILRNKEVGAAVEPGV